ncbi:unnamed protein product [Bathycoccus prasinos]
MHGGLFSDSEITIQRLNAMDRFKEPSDVKVIFHFKMVFFLKSYGVILVILVGFTEALQNFLNKNGLKLVIRSHEVKDQVSIFHIIAILCHRSFHEYFLGLRNSARQQFDHSFQCTKLLGAFIRLKSDMIPEFITFDAVSHPNIPAMFYANPYTKIL